MGVYSKESNTNHVDWLEMNSQEEECNQTNMRYCYNLLMVYHMLWLNFILGFFFCCLFQRSIMETSEEWFFSFLDFSLWVNTLPFWRLVRLYLNWSPTHKNDIYIYFNIFALKTSNCYSHPYTQRDIVLECAPILCF